MLDNKRYPNDIIQRENNFFGRLQSLVVQVSMYDENRKILARKLIPKAKLEAEALKDLNLDSNSVQSNPSNTYRFQDQVLRKLLRWFKLEFFRWVDTPDCNFCGGKTNAAAAVEPTVEELKYRANRVEGYVCSICHSSVRFPRYNDPAKLLETRCGRCGEWANCFTLCALAMDFDARFIMDWTDHVWTEVWSETQQKWLHCDPCENVCDKPLLYEKGWNKKLSYVFAISPDHMVDVTWRYTANFQGTLCRRLECRESRLVDFVHNFNQNKLPIMSQARRDKLAKQSVSELVELINEKKLLSEDESEGRASGSLAWRTARGEQGHAVKPASVTLKPTDSELEAKLFRLVYNCRKDEYTRPVTNERSSGWRSSVFSADRIFRKEEFDWKQVYLARQEGTESGEISWKVALDPAVRIKAVSVDINFCTYENGVIRAVCCLGDQCIMLKQGRNVINEGLENANELHISLSLFGGKGDCAWQHAQLFRESLVGDTRDSLNIEILFR